MLSSTPHNYQLTNLVSNLTQSRVVKFARREHILNQPRRTQHLANKRRMKMKKLVVAAVATAALFAVSAPAFAGFYDVYGYYHTTCGWVATPYGWVQQCG